MSSCGPVEEDLVQEPWFRADLGLEHQQSIHRQGRDRGVENRRGGGGRPGGLWKLSLIVPIFSVTAKQGYQWRQGGRGGIEV